MWYLGTYVIVGCMSLGIFLGSPFSPDAFGEVDFEEIGQLEADQIISEAANLRREGFLIRTINRNKKRFIVVTANDETGLLYGTFKFIRILQNLRNIENLNLKFKNV